MIKDSICCPEEVDTFLAVTRVKPDIERPRRMTTQEIQKLGNELEDVLDKGITSQELDKFWDIKTERQQLEAQRSFLLEQQGNLYERREGR